MKIEQRISSRKAPSPARSKRGGRYLAAQKLSNYQFEKLLHVYAESVVGPPYSVEAVSRRLGLAPNTVADSFHLIRKRLTEIALYPAPEDFRDFLGELSREHPSYFSGREMARLHARLKSGMRGVPTERLKYHLAEAIFAAQNANVTGARLAEMIKVAVKVTGRLNRNPLNLRIWRERHYIFTMQNHIAKLRSMRPTAAMAEHAELIDSYELLITGAERRLRGLLRSGGSNRG